MNMMAKTVEMKLTQSELIELRRKLVVCSHCGTPFYREFADAKVCEICVQEALEKEGFPYSNSGIKEADVVL